jgi:5-oxoprolinase (ATP-hydrolysing)
VSGKWEFWIDRGGTFTDVVACRPDGELVTHKLLSESPEHYSDAAIAAIRHLMSLKAGDPIPPDAVRAVKMGTTVATNALLERGGEPTVLVITEGFRDALRIGYQNRPRLFDRHIRLPEALYSRVLEIRERVDAQGEVIQPLDEKAVHQALTEIYNDGFRSLAVLLMHGYRFTRHELAIERIARRIGFPQVSVSHKISALMKLISRGDTTVVDAYLSPILRRYVNQIASQMSGVRLLFMQSNGGLTDAQSFQGKDSILSGPAGGIVGMARASQNAGFSKVIGFDMGGTSTDVSHYAGEFERQFDTHVAGIRLCAPMMSIHTVAAGGGSILHFDGSRYRVGPDSAGANPGPASYRRGGPLTVTDCNVLLGKIQPEYFPKVFGKTADQGLDRAAATEKFRLLAEEIAGATGKHPTPEQIAEGFLEVAIGNMANAIKFVSVQRGYDLAEYTLTSFGGAGGQHACMVADALGITCVLAHPLAGVLSAYGIGLADQTAMRERAVEAVLSPELVPLLEVGLRELSDEVQRELIGQGVDPHRISIKRRAHLRYEGTDSALVVTYGDPKTMATQFEADYRQRYSFLMPDKALIVEAISVEATGAEDVPAKQTFAKSTRLCPLHPTELIRVFSGGQWCEAPLYRRREMQPGDRLRGPAIIAEPHATIVVEAGWEARMTTAGDLVLTRSGAVSKRNVVGDARDPVMLEIFNSRFMSIAEQMGLRLASTAYSVNIKERLDFSCALFDAQGNLIANAPHIPVHLGSMGDSIRTVINESSGSARPGDVYMLNDPYRGGTHLPDLTVITPVFDGGGKRILFYVGSRAHHADIGGITPGSMPPNSVTVEEEGILISNVKLVESGRLREKEIVDLFAGGRFPARNIPQNLADLRAQIAANQKGVEELGLMVSLFGLEVVQSYMRHVQDNAEEAVRRVIAKLKDGHFEYRLDNGAVIAVSIRVDGAKRRACIDFTGTSPQQSNNFNAPSAVCTAAVLYVFRTLVDDEIPLNAGCLKPLSIVIPEGSMLKPRYPAAVVAGNVETSSCITNALYGALGNMGSSQGTMNNFTFGNDRLQYYETISGGSGAGLGFHGTDAVQTHMTNSRLTDPEILEWRYPVRLESFEIRAHSGGDGEWRGGNGAIRKIRFLEKMTASILSNNRLIPPFGAHGGAPGSCGRNYLIRANGVRENIGFVANAEMNAGDVFVIETPGGGGYGEPRRLAKSKVL